VLFRSKKAILSGLKNEMERKTLPPFNKMRLKPPPRNPVTIPQIGIMSHALPQGKEMDLSVKYTYCPKTIRAVAPANITAVKMSPLVFSSKDRPISSIAKTIPASGALKMAANPAELPARIRPLSR